MKPHLVYYGSEILLRKASPVEPLSIPSSLLSEMFHIMDELHGVGLAAPQLGLLFQIIAVDLTRFEDGPRISMVNPSIVWNSGDLVLYEEGCLSIPGIYHDILRPSKIVVQGLTYEGKQLEFEADGLLSRVLQHEIDHLNGILFIDKIDPSAKKKYTKELKSIAKLNKKGQ
jgi:peptide deformylase